MQFATLREETINLRASSWLLRAWQVLQEHRGLFAKIALVTILPSLLVLWVAASFVALLVLGVLAASERLIVFALGGGVPLAVAAGVLVVMTAPLSDGAITEATLRTAAGERPSLREVIGAASRHWRALMKVHLVALVSRLLPAGLVFIIGALVSVIGAVSQGDPDAVWSLLMVLFFVLFPFTTFVAIVSSAFTAKPRLFATPLILRHHDWRDALRESKALANAARAVPLGVRLVLSWAPIGAALVLFSGIVLAVAALLSFGVIEAFLALTIALALLGGALVFAMLLVSGRQILVALLFAQLAPARERAPESAAPAGSLAQAAPQSASPSNAPMPQSAATLLPSELATLPAGRRLSFYYEKVRAFGETAHDLNEMAAALMEIGDLWGARGWLDRARALDPNNTEVLLNLATVHYRLRDAETARELLREYLRLESDPEKLTRARQSAMLRALLPNDAENA